MNEKTTEALETIIKEVRSFAEEKWGQRKRLSQNEVWRQAIIYRDVVQVENWLKKIN